MKDAVKRWPNLRCVAQLYLNDGFNEFLAPALDAFEDELIVAGCSRLDDGEPDSSFTIGTSSVEQRIVPLRIELGVQLTLPQHRTPPLLNWGVDGANRTRKE